MAAGQIQLSPLFKIKFNWNTATPTPIHLCTVYGCFHIELSSCDGDHMTHKASDIYCWALYRKILLTPGLEDKGEEIFQRVEQKNKDVSAWILQ